MQQCLIYVSNYGASHVYGADIQFVNLGYVQPFKTLPSNAAMFALCYKFWSLNCIWGRHSVCKPWLSWEYWCSTMSECVTFIQYLYSGLKKSNLGYHGNNDIVPRVKNIWVIYIFWHADWYLCFITMYFDTLWSMLLFCFMFELERRIQWNDDSHSYSYSCQHAKLVKVTARMVEGSWNIRYGYT